MSSFTLRFHAAHRQRRIHHQQVRGRCDQRDRAETVDRIVRQVLLQARIHAESAGGEQYRITVGRCASDRFRTDHAGAARTVVDDDLLLQRVAHFHRDGARDQVGVSARSLRDHHAYRLGRVVGRGCR
jgi:hypothetical protein